MFGLSPVEMLVVGVVAVLLFGSRLPSVARSAGKSLTEFKRGMQDVSSGWNDAINTDPDDTPSSRHVTYDDSVEPSAPKFEPPSAEETESVEIPTESEAADQAAADERRATT